MERRYRDTKIYIKYLENTDRYICIVSFSDAKDYYTYEYFQSKEEAIKWAENYIDIVKGRFTYQVDKLKNEWKRLMKEVKKSLKEVKEWLIG